MLDGESEVESNPGADGGVELERPDHISQEGWDALPDEDRKAVHSLRQSQKSLRKNYDQLSAQFAEVKGKVDGLMAGGVHQNGNGAKKEVTDYTDAELKEFLARARAARSAFSADSTNEEARKYMGLLGDGSLEEDARIELAARQAVNRTKPELERARAEQVGRERAQALHNRIMGIVGAENMAGMLSKGGGLNEDHPLVSAAREKAQEMLQERGIDPKNAEAVSVVIETAFRDVMAERRSRGEVGDRGPRGRLELFNGGGANPHRGRPAAGNISALLRQGKVAEAHDQSLKDYFSGRADMPDEFVVGPDRR